ncbi:hypothetical protein C5167_032070 [Papaver somniferum]|uniref:Smr domain-containing protein n=1 Tax=Papaver somniferum TaxID=3469 RepID=A0A4Y7K842_PAPSO|nr:hypothetical protein C5167_032070 [Papaver somniferum]
MNHKNDVWKLDLHGLHASEVVHALKERLWRIETQFPLTVHPNKVVKPIDSSSCLSVAGQTEKDEGMTSQRPGVLQVITVCSNWWVTCTWMNIGDEVQFCGQGWI